MRGVRFSDETNAWLDEYAVSRSTDPSAVIRTAVEEFRKLCVGGVPDLVAPEKVIMPKPAAKGTPRQDPDPASALLLRHRRLAREMGWTS